MAAFRPLRLRARINGLARVAAAADALRQSLDELSITIDDGALTGSPPLCGSCIHFTPPPDPRGTYVFARCMLRNRTTDRDATVVHVGGVYVRSDHYCAAHEATPAPIPDHPTVVAFEADLALLEQEGPPAFPLDPEFEGPSCDGSCPDGDPCPDCEA